MQQHRHWRRAVCSSILTPSVTTMAIITEKITTAAITAIITVRATTAVITADAAITTIDKAQTPYTAKGFLFCEFADGESLFHCKISHSTIIMRRFRKKGKYCKAAETEQ